MAETTRRLAAILSADVAGYSRLMGDDEAATVAALDESRAIFRERIAAHKGRVVDTAGDSVLSVFDSVVEAVQCAVAVQEDLARRNQALPEDRRMRFRIGVNLGDIIAKDDGTIYGDGVNIAARLESLAEPGGVTLSEDAYRQVRNKTDVGFEDIGEHTAKNIAEPVRAYRVVAEADGATTPSTRKKGKAGLMAAAAVVLMAVAGVATWYFAPRPEAPPAPVESAPVERMGPPLSEKPSIAVLPFDNMSGDPEQDYFADGLTEEIIGALARLPDLAVIARNSTFRYKDQSIDVRAVGRQLGVRYLIEGSVRRAADTVRVTAQLIETESGAHLWSETYDRALTPENLFAIQDDIAAAVATTLGDRYGIIRQAGLAVAKRKPPASLSAYECVLLAMEHLRTLSAGTNKAARVCLERAVETDPGYMAAWANLARIYVDAARMDYDPRPDALDRALDAARRAVALAPSDAEAHWSLAHVHFFRGELDAFKVEAERTIETADKGASVLASAGLFLAYAGEWDKGLALIDEAAALDPHHPGWYHAGAFFDHYRKGEYEQALATAQRMGLPDYVWTNASVAAAYGQLGRRDDARPTVRLILELDPDFAATARASRWKWFRYQEDLLDHFMDGLRKAGLDIPDAPD